MLTNELQNTERTPYDLEDATPLPDAAGSDNEKTLSYHAIEGIKSNANNTIPRNAFRRVVDYFRGKKRRELPDLSGLKDHDPPSVYEILDHVTSWEVGLGKDGMPCMRAEIGKINGDGSEGNIPPERVPDIITELGESDCRVLDNPDGPFRLLEISSRVLRHMYIWENIFPKDLAPEDLSPPHIPKPDIRFKPDIHLDDAATSVLWDADFCLHVEGNQVLLRPGPRADTTRLGPLLKLLGIEHDDYFAIADMQHILAIGEYTGGFALSEMVKHTLAKLPWREHEYHVDLDSVPERVAAKLTRIVRALPVDFECVPHQLFEGDAHNPQNKNHLHIRINPYQSDALHSALSRPDDGAESAEQSPWRQDVQRRRALRARNKGDAPNTPS